MLTSISYGLTFVSPENSSAQILIPFNVMALGGGALGVIRSWGVASLNGISAFLMRDSREHSSTPLPHHARDWRAWLSWSRAGLTRPEHAGTLISGLQPLLYYEVRILLFKPRSLGHSAMAALDCLGHSCRRKQASQKPSQFAVSSCNRRKQCLLPHFQTKSLGAGRSSPFWVHSQGRVSCEAPRPTCINMDILSGTHKSPFP